MKGKDTTKKSFDINYGAAVLLIIWALIFLLESRKIADPGSKMFPYVICGLTVLIAVILVVKAKFNLGQQEEYNLTGTGKAMVYAIILLIYVAVTYFFGFYISTPIYLVAGMLILGQRNIKTLASVAILTTLIIFLFFDLLLGMRIPTGIFF